MSEKIIRRRSRSASPNHTVGSTERHGYRIIVAEAQGGLGGSLLDWFDMATVLAEADASTGWIASHGACVSALIANTADAKFVETFFADPGALGAWSNLPRLQAEEVEGGLTITGRWSFESGCTAATWVGGMLPRPNTPDDEPPQFVVALAPIDEAAIEKNLGPRRAGRNW